MRRDASWRRTSSSCTHLTVWSSKRALYLWSISEVIPVGDDGTITEYNLQQLKSDVMSDKLFGYVECDIRVPEHLFEHFSEMCPIFKNIDINGTKDIIGEHMADYCTANNIPCKKSRKLIGSMKGDKILLYTPLLKWYLEHGLEITKFIKILHTHQSNSLKV
jgi:hypothetical protein